MGHPGVRWLGETTKRGSSTPSFGSVVRSFMHGEVGILAFGGTGRRKVDVDAP